jgi:chemotaxis regulatin CheY-phosphate phosphatase CheZ
MNVNEIDELLKKTDDLKTLMGLVHKVLPFVEDVFLFIKDIKPLFDEINSNINENVSKMPDVSDKLSKVTAANEVATIEIMNTIDDLFRKSEEIENLNSDLNNEYGIITNNTLQILRDLIHSNDIKLNERYNNNIKSIIEDISNFNTEKLTKFNESTSSLLAKKKEDYSSIMISLQVQDITSQQIAAVDYMLKEVERRLIGILNKFNNTDISDIAEISGLSNDSSKPTNVTKFHREIAFDPDAVNAIDEQKSRQDDIDKLFSGNGFNDFSDEEDSEKDTSQEDIDALFSK